MTLLIFWRSFGSKQLVVPSPVILYLFLDVTSDNWQPYLLKWFSNFDFFFGNGQPSLVIKGELNDFQHNINDLLVLRVLIFNSVCKGYSTPPRTFIAKRASDENLIFDILIFSFLFFFNNAKMLASAYDHVLFIAIFWHQYLAGFQFVNIYSRFSDAGATKSPFKVRTILSFQ